MSGANSDRKIVFINRCIGILIVLSVITAISKYGIYTLPFRTFGMLGYWHPLSVIGNLMSVIFVIAPLLSAYSFYKKKRQWHLWTSLFLLVAFFFGVVPIPFADYFYSEIPNLNSIFIAVVNGSCLIAVFAFWKRTKP